MSNTDALGFQLDVFHWIRDEDHLSTFGHDTAELPQHKRITAEEVVKKHGVPRHVVSSYIECEINETEAFGSLPFTLLFVVAYAMMVIIHDDAVVIRAVEDSVEFDIIDNANFAYDGPYMGHKDIHDVNTVGDFWSWCSIGFLPLLFQQEVSFAEGRNMSDPLIVNASRTFTLDERGVLLQYNRIVGGIRFRQERSREVPCTSPPGLLEFFNKTCVGTGYELDPESWDARGMNNPERDVYFYTIEDMEVMQHRLLEMEAANWLDRFTKKIEISIPVYTAEFGLHALITVNFYFARGGHIWKQIIPYSTYADWWTYRHYIAYDIVWLLCLLQIFNTEWWEVRRMSRDKGWKALWTDYLGFWNAVDWISVFGGLVIVILCILSIDGTNRCNNATVQLAEVERPLHDPTYPDLVRNYHDSLEAVVHYVHIFKLVLSTYPLVIVLRLFKAFAAQPRLALVTNTLVITGVDLAHFLLVFTSIFVTLAISGLVLFGRRLDTFTTFPRAINTVFRLMLGDFDWEAIRTVGRMEGAIWLFLALSIMNLLLLNMVLAIVMDGYSEVKKRSISTDTLVAELGQIWTRWWGVKRGRLLELTTINTALILLERDFSKGKNKFATVAEMLDESKGTVLLGRHTVAVLGMCVAHVEDDINEFVGPGKVVEVGHLKCRVLHDDGNYRDYSIGHDLIYELKYVAGGAKPEALNEEEEGYQSLQILSAERFQKVVSNHAGKRMHMDQARDLLTAAVTHYYNQHSQGADIDNIRQNLRKIVFRTKKIKEVFRDGGGGQSLSMNAAAEMKLLRDYLVDFYAAVDANRQSIRKEISGLRAAVAELHMRLLKVQPDAARELEQQLKESGVITVSDKAMDLQLLPASALAGRGARAERSNGTNGHGTASSSSKSSKGARTLPGITGHGAASSSANGRVAVKGVNGRGSSGLARDIVASSSASGSSARTGRRSRPHLPEEPSSLEGVSARRLRREGSNGRESSLGRDRERADIRIAAAGSNRPRRLDPRGTGRQAREDFRGFHGREDAGGRFSGGVPAASFATRSHAPSVTPSVISFSELEQITIDDEEAPLPPPVDFEPPNPNIAYGGTGAAGAYRGTGVQRSLVGRAPAVVDAGAQRIEDLDDDGLLAEVDALLNRSAAIRQSTAAGEDRRRHDTFNHRPAGARSVRAGRSRSTGVYRPPPSR